MLEATETNSVVLVRVQTKGNCVEVGSRNGAHALGSSLFDKRHLYNSSVKKLLILWIKKREMYMKRKEEKETS